MAKERVNHPDHYKSGGFEVIDIIECFSLNFCLGNVLKYLLRAGRKSEDTHIEDLEKARWYLDREIASLKKLREKPQKQSRETRVSED